MAQRKFFLLSACAVEAKRQSQTESHVLGPKLATKRRPGKIQQRDSKESLFFPRPKEIQESVTRTLGQLSSPARPPSVFLPECTFSFCFNKPCHCRLNVSYVSVPKSFPATLQKNLFPLVTPGHQ